MKPTSHFIWIELKAELFSNIISGDKRFLNNIEKYWRHY